MPASTLTVPRRQLAIAVSLALGCGAAHADTFEVTNTDDSGAGSLRQAIIDANGAAGPHTIDMSQISGETITLEAALDDIVEELDIQGSDVTLDGDGSYSCLYAYGYDMSVSSLTVTNCTGHDFGGTTYGGGIEVYGGGLDLTDSVVTGNDAYIGGGLSVLGGDLTITGSRIENNTGYAYGGVLHSGGSFTMSDSQIVGNDAAYFGAGYWYSDYGFAGQTLSISSSTISDNTATNALGGPVIGAYDHQALTIENSTISGNSAPAVGGAYLANVPFKYYGGDLEADLTGTTITGNEATGGAGGGLLVSIYASGYYGYGATAEINNAIISGNAATSGSPDLESDAALGGNSESRPLAGFFQFAMNNPQHFQRRDPQRKAKFGLDSGPLEESEVVEFFESRLDALGGPVEGGVDVIFNANYSIIGVPPTTGVFNPDTVTGDNIGSDPALGGLADNGGPTLTHLPGDGSSAIDLIPDGDNDCGAGFNVDQRGEPRPEAGGSACDAGSVEVGEGGGGEIPESQPVPTMSRLGVILMALGLGVLGFFGLRRHARSRIE